MSLPIKPGLMILHGNRLEMLRDVVFDWLARNPLEPLEEEIFLVQSNGAAEWLKMSLASANGVCAATRVELPGRFLWRTYRQVLGRERVAPQSALDREALTWRLMRLLPELLDRPSFASVAAFLADRDPQRRLQLAKRLAELFDQYQVYRTDWLAAWEHRRATLPRLGSSGPPMPEDQRWQAELWRALLDELTDAQRWSTRPQVHRAFMDEMAANEPSSQRLPRRVVLFGASHIATQGLEALAALSARMQVVFAIPNPSRYHWADIIDGREVARQQRQRHPSKGGQDLAVVPLEAMHLHAHPLLAMWGRQGRDFMRQLDAFDDEAMRRQFDVPRFDLFDEGPGATLLMQVQAAIRDLVPLKDHPQSVVGRADRSIVFHVAHGVQREVEILHDQLLTMFAETDADAPLRPRDVVVMVPDIEMFAPSIRAVFGQYDRRDARFIPFDIADLRSRGSNPLVAGVEWLLRLPEQRIRLQEVRDLLDIPAVAARFGIAADALPGLFNWLAGAGVRWGLHETQRASLGLGAAGEQNSWLFGIRRMLLGYASGTARGFADIEPYDEIGGLDAAVIGALIDLFERLEHWWSIASGDATPAEWAAHGRALLDTFFDPTDERERLTRAALENALSAWLAACETAAFEERVPLTVMREAWLTGIDGLDASRRFMTGGVTFCTLMPLRAVPFEVVCLLGMNDGDFPRPNRRNDFDLMALPGHERPGDRSRRDDDRYLMLEALLSARRMLYVSWCGRNVRDNEKQPPSVLVAQLRDYLKAGWLGEDGADVLDTRTTEHPMQPFSRRYFEIGGSFTYAREWRLAHDAVGVVEDSPLTRSGDPAVLTADQLARFLRNPVRDFFRARLHVQAPDETASIDDDETFALGGLAKYQARQMLLDDPEDMASADVDLALTQRLAQMRGAGALPMFELGTRVGDEMLATVRPMIDRWIASRLDYPQAVPKRALRFIAGDVEIDDWLDGLRSDGESDVLVTTTPSRLLDQKGVHVDAYRLISLWVTMLVASACDTRIHALMIGNDATLTITPLATDEATVLLLDLIAAWKEGTMVPLPIAAKTALAFVDENSSTSKVRDAYEGSRNAPNGENKDFGLRRLFPDHAHLVEDGRFTSYAQRLYAPLQRWARSSVTIVRHETSPIADEIDS
jgi:exodeoxyribonuclease V gamma subunit